MEDHDRAPRGGGDPSAQTVVRVADPVVDRRDFLVKALTLSLAGAALAGVTFAGGLADAQGGAGAAQGAATLMPPPPPPSSAGEDEDVLIRMQRDLRRALAKPVAERRWGMVIDTRKCTGCSACTVACVMENKLPPGVVYRPVIDTEVGEYPNVTRKFLPRPCMQCDQPPCVKVCPVGATYKRPDGIVAIDYDACIGCRYCIAACPYQARTFDFGEHWTDDAAMVPGTLAAGLAVRRQDEPAFEYGKAWPRQEGRSPIDNARKCHFCLHRLEQGMLPACVTTCIGRATFFGDLNDPESLVSEMAAQPSAVRLKEWLGTEPKVFYLV